ncbi:gliolectin [Drosophila biarmipes]|uniref:gliolectin n=1 Tax=Drosophila biarmipes TaxID=125945 RepID=UPI0007E6D28D|nr:gliolectin [Drosophila biarmipes]
MAILCPPMSLTLQRAPPAPRPPPSALETKRIRRNLFDTVPGDSNIDQLLAQEQCSKRLYVKERYGVDILLEDRRELDADAAADGDADADAPRGMRYPTVRAIASADADEYDPKSISRGPRGVALTAPQISASAKLILQKCTQNGSSHSHSDSNKSDSSSADLANNSTRHGQKPYAAQPQGLKGIYRVRKANKGISKVSGKNTYPNNNNNNINHNVDNGTSELGDKEQ